jgi:hypothetical protein
MKRIRILALLMLVAIGFTGCQTEPVDPAVLDNNPPEPTLPGNASFTVQFGGQTFEADATQAIIEGGLITVGGMRGTDGETVAFMLAANAEGTYTASLENEDSVIFSYTPTANAEYTYNNFNDTGINGTVTISEIDEVNHTISGTFSFTGYYGDTEANLPPVMFTNGQFTDIPYQTDVINPGEDGEYFNATFGGEDWEFDIFGAAASGGNLSLSANDFATSTMISLYNIDEDIAPGTYPLGDDFTQGPVASVVLNDDMYTSSTGTLTIVSNENGYIQGTFNFTATNLDDQSIPVTNGEFNIEVF